VPTIFLSNNNGLGNGVWAKNSHYFNCHTHLTVKE